MHLLLPLPFPRSQISNLKFEISFAVAFSFVGAPACCARPCNACEKVAYLPPREAIRHSPRSIGLMNGHDVKSAI